MDPERGTLAAALRRAAGGEVEALTSDDPVIDPLLSHLRDAYAVLLLPRARVFVPPLSLFDHPKRAELEQAVLADEDLSQLFPEVSEHSGPVGSYIGPNRGGGIQLWTLPSQLVTTAFDWARLDANTPTLTEVANKLEVVVDLLRRAVRGETVAVPVRIALAGVLPPEGADSIEIAGTTLRRRDHRDDWLFALTGDQKVTSTDADGKQIEISYSGDLIVEATMDYRILLGQVSDSGWPAELSILPRKLDARVEAIRLALALVESDNDPALVLPGWSFWLDPLGHGPCISWRDASRNRKLSPRQLTPQDVNEWDAWAKALAAQDLSRVEIAVRRVLRALGERTMPEDVLIDSVMAWENLFGAAQETTFRVCGSLTWLLSDGGDERAQLMKELKQIYQLRSRIVHGSGSLADSDHVSPRRALTVALDALRALLTKRTDLLAEPDGPTRSNRILLGG